MCILWVELCSAYHHLPYLIYEIDSAKRQKTRLTQDQANDMENLLQTDSLFRTVALLLVSKFNRQYLVSDTFHMA